MAKYEVSIDGKEFEVEIVRDDGQRALVVVDGQEYEVDARNVSVGSTPIAAPPLAAAIPAPQRAPSAAAAPPTAGGSPQARAPMPGLVLEVCIAVGQKVSSGDVLVRLEAMKMENDVKSSLEGTVKEIMVAQGDEVREGQVLVVLED